MEYIDIIKVICDKLNKLFGWNIPEEVIEYIIFIIAAGTILYGIVKFIIWVCGLIGKMRQKPWREETIKKILTPDYCSQLAEQKYFISTKFTTTPPNNLEDPMEVERTQSAKNLIDYFIDSVLVEANSTNRFYCILAGAGMGKTTWAVNLVTSYIKHYKKSTCPFDINLISLAHKDFADMVQQIEEKNRTILILDALDENAEASASIEEFMQKLDDLIRNFRFVILTSRTQFFPSEEDEPHKTSILRLSGDKGNYEYHKMYISPFTQDDVAAFLGKKYRNRKKRKKAEAIVKRCASLATRPLLLSHLDDILESDQEYITLYDIYTALIDAWIKREVRFFSGEVTPELCEQLYDFSLNFAIQLFVNREQSTNMRMRREQYNQFIAEYKYTNYNFSGRSLINRDAEGTLKFSHKTFYEYFLAKAKFINPDMELPDSGYELAWTFYELLVKSRLNKMSSSIVMINDDTMLCLRRLGLANFDYRWLINVVNIKRVGVTAILLNNNIDNFTSWITKSNVEVVDVINYQNESLKKLLLLSKLKEVNLLNSAKITTKGRLQMQKLEERGVLVSETKWKLYPYSNSLYLYRRQSSNDTLSMSLMIEGYLHYLRSSTLTQSLDLYIKS